MVSGLKIEDKKIYTMQDKINQYNKKNQLHGYWEHYNASGYYINGIDYGFWVENKGKVNIYYAR
jgi:hypothetical protein